MTDAPTPTPDRRTNTVLAAGAAAGFLALAISLFAVLFWVTDDDDVATGPGASAAVAVSLTEFAIDPMRLDPSKHSALEVNFLGTHIPAGTPGDIALKGGRFMLGAPRGTQNFIFDNEK